MMPKRVLVAPLDWGLGHAARCIPIIDELRRQGAEVVLAADGRPYDLLRKEFPDLQMIRFPGYAIQYSDRSNLLWTIIQQLPAFLRGIKKEHEFLGQIIQNHQFDIVISDSRYGVYHRPVYSIFIIHQLRILLPSPFRWFENILSLISKSQIKKFNECWIPDNEQEPSLSGILSHSTPLPRNGIFIGPLSRIQAFTADQKDFDILAVLSGPEPQRTVFEDLLIEQLKRTHLRAFIVRGIPERSTRIKLTDTITAVSSLSSAELSKFIAASHIIVARSGYSTVMDLSFVGAKAIFVPTPQQTEQEYLAAALKEKMICYSEAQNVFNLERSLAESGKYSGFSPQHNTMQTVRERISFALRNQSAEHQ